MLNLIVKLNQNRFYINYKRMWPYVKPIWFRALLSLLICIPIGSLDAIIALALKPYMDLVMIEKSIASPWYIPLGIVLFTSVQGGLKYLSAYLLRYSEAHLNQEFRQHTLQNRQCSYRYQARLQR